MNFDLRDNWRRLLWRLLVAAPFFGGGFWALCHDNPFYGAALIIIGAMIAAFPTAMLAYAGRIEVAFKHRHDQARADAAYRQGMAALTDREQQACLHRLYTALQSWAANPPR